MTDTDDRHFLAAGFEPQDRSSTTGFAGNRLDRWAEGRTEDALERALADPSARMFAIARGRTVLRFDGAPRALMELAELEAFAPKAERAVLLGFDGGAPRLAVPVGADPEMLPTPWKALDLRSIAAQGLLARSEEGQLAQAHALLSWHASARFCGRCGTATESRDAGAKRYCPSCERDQFPRTDPVVIMLTVSADGQRCLLGRSPHFPEGMVSALAGFVEAGETIEMAVRRETFEEAGIRTGRVAYHASQPWPFPHNLMLGLYAEALDEEITCDDAELEMVRWFTRDEVRAALAGRGDGAWTMPQRVAIAHRLIADWADGSAGF